MGSSIIENLEERCGRQIGVQALQLVKPFIINLFQAK